MVTEAQIQQALKPHASKKRADHALSYMMTAYELLGCNMPTIRAVADRFKDTDTKNLDHIWKTSNSFDVLYVLLVILSNQSLTEKHWPIVKRWAKKIDNWAHSDLLSSMIAKLLEEHPSKIYKDLQRWNTSSNPWLRRLSLTSLLYYNALRKKRLPASKILPLVESCLDDGDTYVQKAVGWTLREAGNCYPKKAEVFILKNLNRLSPIAFTTATEKWSAAKKSPLKTARKEFRAKARANQPSA